jgi:hypothetical protein
MGHKWLWHYFNFFVTITFIVDSSAFSFVYFWVTCLWFCLFLSHLSVIIFWKHCFKTFLQFVWSSMDTYSTILEINWGISEASILHVSKHVCMNQYHVLLFTNSGTTRKLLPLYIQIHTKIFHFRSWQQFFCLMFLIFFFKFYHLI